MPYTLSKQSLAKLDGVHPDLARVVWRAIEITTQDFKVAEGVRSPEQAAANAAKGVGVANSLHIRQADGYAHAVDLWPVPLDWKNIPAFDRVAAAMYQAADELSVLIQWGADWDADGIPRERSEYDHPHFQLPAPHRLPDCRQAHLRRIAARASGEELVL